MADPHRSAQWHERTVERSLRTARARAISRGDQFIAAAAQLLRERGRPDFTVQEVVDRSGMSLRSFYHHFAGKDDLLLAMIEETVIHYADRVRKAISSEPDPVERLHVYMHEMLGGDNDHDAAARGMALFHWQLAESRAEEFVAVLQPQVDLLVEILEAGARSGQFRTDVSPPQLAVFLTQSLVSRLNMTVLEIAFDGVELGTDDFWRCCLGAVSARPPAPSNR